MRQFSTIKEAAECLAVRHSLGRAREKVAISIDEIVAKVRPHYDSAVSAATPVVNNLMAGAREGAGNQENVGWEAARNALIGAGIGGTVGLGRSLFSRDRRKSMLGDALTGAVMGGALGGGGTLGYRGLRRAAPEAFGDMPTTDMLKQIETAQLQQASGDPEAAATAATKLTELGALAKERGVDMPTAPQVTPAAAKWQLGNYPAAAAQFASDNPAATAGAAAGAATGYGGTRWLQERNIGKTISRRLADADYDGAHSSVAEAVRGTTPGAASVRPGLPGMLGGQGVLQADPHTALPGVVRSGPAAGAKGPKQMSLDDFQSHRGRALGGRSRALRGGATGILGGTGFLGGQILDEHLR